MSPLRLLTLAIVATAATSTSTALAQETAPAPAPSPALAPLPEPAPAPQDDPQAPLPPPASQPISNETAPPPEAAESRAPAHSAERRPQLVLGAFFGVGSASFGTGLGLRVGYQAKSRVYVGGLFQYHFGESEDSGSPGFITTTGVTYFIHQFEVGYAGKAGPVEIRPYFGVGPGFGFTSREGYLGASTFSPPGRTHPTAVITPIGLSVAVDLGNHAYVGIDGRPMFFVQTFIPQGVVGLIAGARF